MPPSFLQRKGGGADEYIRGTVTYDRVFGSDSDADLLDCCAYKGDKQRKKIITLPRTQDD